MDRLMRSARACTRPVHCPCPFSRSLILTILAHLSPHLAAPPFLSSSSPQVPNQPDAFEFSIRTPVTPPRWKEFDAELEAAWEAVLQAMLQGGKGGRKKGRAIHSC